MIVIIQRTETDHDCYKCGHLIPSGSKCFKKTSKDRALTGLMETLYICEDCFNNGGKR